MAEIYKIGSDDIVDKVSEFGGTNLLPGTSDWSGAGRNTTYAAIQTDKYAGTNILKIIKSASASSYVDVVYWNSVIAPKGGTTYTLSFWAKADAASSFISYFYPTNVASGKASNGATVGASASGSDGNITWTLTTDWKRYWVNWTTIAGVSGNKNLLLCRILAANTGTYYIAGVKLEEGNKPTDWTPAPADLVTVSDTELQFF